MKIQNFAIYHSLILIFASLSLPATANEIDESRTVKDPITANSLQENQNAQLLLSDAESDSSVSDTEEILEINNTNIEYSLTPLQLHPFDPMTVETANTLPEKAFYTTYGANIFSTGSQGAGTGLQVFNGSIDYGINDNLQIGLATSFFDDTLSTRFNGQRTNFGIFALAPRIKYKFIDRENYDVAVVGSVEWLKVTSENGLFNGGDLTSQDNTLAGTIQVPFTYSFDDVYQWYLVGGLSIFPDTINNGGDYYGTFFNIGTGISFKFAEQFGFFADINLPLGPGGNSVNTRGDIGKTPVWSAGFNYLHSPAVGVDLSITNRLGSTPATRLLAFPPDGGNVGVGLNVRYTPDIFADYAPSFGDTAMNPLTDRDKQLLFDGFILTTPNTINKGTFSLDTGLSPNYNIQLGYGLSNNAQLEFTGQQLASNDEPIGDSMKLGAATKLNFLSQANGDPFSFGIRGAFGEASDIGDGVGSFSAEAAFSYSANENISLFFNPKAGLFGDNRILGAGFGVNFQPVPGLQFIGEVTPMISNDPTVWAAGARYMPPKTNFGIGVYGSNAAGSTNISNVIRQKDNNVSVGFNVMWLLGNN